VTPDSFFDGGRHVGLAAVLEHCRRLIDEGADILDIGGESTRPGAVPPGPEVEMERVLPVLREAVALGVPVSVDTSEPALMRAALALGVDIINDVRSLRREGALDCVSSHPSVGVCLMHMRGEPMTMQGHPDYSDVVAEVRSELAQRLGEVSEAGVGSDRIALDPGIGFGKTADHNLALLARQHELLALGRPLVVGWSRKGTLGAITGQAVDGRLPASVAAALASVHRGASVVRVHDVRATVDALKVWRAAERGRLESPCTP
jgi:dihydropteroate synthase